MRTAQETIDEMQSALEGWVFWAQRLEAAVLANPVECRCWADNGRSGNQDHIGACAEWRAVASAIRTKPKMSAGPIS